MEDRVEEIRREHVFLLQDLLRSGNYFGVRNQFKDMLIAIQGIADKDSPVMFHKRRKLDQFKTTVLICEDDRSDLVDEKIQRWKNQASEKCFLIYKASDGWGLVGRNIAGKNINQPVVLLNEADSLIKDKLNNILPSYSISGDLSIKDPLHLLVVDYFGYFRPSLLVSYSWPDPKYSARYAQDELNRQAVHEIANDLSCAGFRVLIDKDDLSPGLNLNRFISLIADPKTDYVGVMATPLYKAKYLTPSTTLGGDNNKTSVEGEAIVSQALANRDFDDRVLIFLLEGAPRDSLIPLLEPKIFNKFTTNDYFSTMIRIILHAYKMERTNKQISDLINQFDNKCRTIKLSNVIKPMKQKPVVIFTDPGVDDFAALGLALAPKAIDVKGIVACAGNIKIVETIQNTLNICHLANRREIPVLKGAERQMNGDPITTDYAAHGDNGLNKVKLEIAPHSIKEGNAKDFVIDLLKASRHPITLISLAGLTDVALVLREAKKLNLLDKIAGISMMGGVFDYENANAPKHVEKFTEKYGEFNFLADPDATHLVFEICNSRSIPIPVVLFDLNFTHHHCRFTRTETERMRQESPNELSKKIAEALDEIPQVYRDRFPNDPPSQPVHDLFPVMALIDESFFEGEYVHIECQSNSNDFPGRVDIVNNERCPKVFRVRVIPSEKQQAFFEKYVEILKTYPTVTHTSLASNQSSLSSAKPSNQTAQPGNPSREYGPSSPGLFKDGGLTAAESSRGQYAASPRQEPERPVEVLRPPEVTRIVAHGSFPQGMDPADARGWLEVASQFSPPKSQLKGEPDKEIVTSAYIQSESRRNNNNRGPSNK